MQYGCFFLPSVKPFVIAVGGNQTAMLGKQLLERAFLVDRLAARVDHAGSDLFVIRPAWYQSPAERLEQAMMTLFGFNDRKHRLRR